MCSANIQIDEVKVLSVGDMPVPVFIGLSEDGCRRCGIHNYAEEPVSTVQKVHELLRVDESLASAFDEPIAMHILQR